MERYFKEITKRVQDIANTKKPEAVLKLAEKWTRKYSDTGEIFQVRYEIAEMLFDLPEYQDKIIGGFWKEPYRTWFPYLLHYKCQIDIGRYKKRSEIRDDDDGDGIFCTIDKALEKRTDYLRQIKALLKTYSDVEEISMEVRFHTKTYPNGMVHSWIMQMFYEYIKAVKSKDAKPSLHLLKNKEILSSIREISFDYDFEFDEFFEKEYKFFLEYDWALPKDFREWVYDIATQKTGIDARFVVNLLDKKKGKKVKVS